MGWDQGSMRIFNHKNAYDTFSIESDLLKKTSYSNPKLNSTISGFYLDSVDAESVALLLRP